ncbi:MAG: hypothetical protein VX019_02000 [Pseudomonadota bacterium]|nr:hypothetical protein [Pseudomonadota bacterium]
MVDALSAFAAFHMTTFSGKTVQLPLSTFVSQLVTPLKLRHLQPRGQVLEVGAVGRRSSLSISIKSRSKPRHSSSGMRSI